MRLAARGEILIVLLAVLVPSSVAPAIVSPLSYWTTHSLHKVRPHDPGGSRTVAEIAAARNEFESFQVVLSAAGRDVRGVDVEVSDLVADDGAEIPSRHTTVYRQIYLELDRPSSRQGDDGEWPDPLVPRVDRYEGERRNAFPFTVRHGRNQPLWVEVYVPADARPGQYRGELSITADGEPALTVPLVVEVWPFVLPSTSSLPTSFGFSGLSASRGHGYDVNDERARLRLAHLYGKAALLHRISLHGGSSRPPHVVDYGDGPRIDWDEYDDEVRPFLEGTVLDDDDPLPGARVTSIDVRTPPALRTDAERSSYWRQWVDHFRDQGWLDRLFFYLWDEPQAGETYRQVEELGKLLRRADPGLRTLLTEQRVADLEAVVDIWVTLVNCVDAKPGHSSFCEETVPRSGYDDHQTVWWYQSCASHGCNVVGDAYFEGWPSYVIDAPATANRIMQWLTWRYGIDGELYFNTVEAYQGGNDPWQRIRLHGGNGDGTLFYPGRPDTIGGKSSIPVESLRLKLIRDGLEDYEYFVLLAEAGAREIADGEVEEVAPLTYHWASDPETLLSARRRMAEQLARISHRPSTAGAERRVSTALRSVGALDVLHEYDCGPLGRAPCGHAPLHALATNGDETCGLAASSPTSIGSPGPQP